MSRIIGRRRVIGEGQNMNLGFWRGSSSGGKFPYPSQIPSGKHTKNSWENPPICIGKTHYKWSFSIAFCMFTRGYIIPFGVMARISTDLPAWLWNLWNQAEQLVIYWVSQVRVNYCSVEDAHIITYLWWSFGGLPQSATNDRLEKIATLSVCIK